MGQGIEYTAREPDSTGRIRYTAAEHAVWETLIKRQRALLPERACQPFIDAADQLGFSDTHIPQCVDISERLKPLTGWPVTPVPTLIPADAFFTVLSNKQFPAASFIRDAR
ncbi:MAG: phenylalanine 4-monooxygenase, partial [Pseudomonadota bacterium]